MDILNIILSFVIGFILIFLLSWILNLKTKGFVRIVVNSLAGIAFVLLINAFKIIYIPLNAFNGILIGSLGVVGIVTILILMLWL